MKTARFAQIVERCGAPDTYLLWVPPRQDKHFQRALAEHRIMTIHSQNVGAKKDSATVGFVDEPSAQYLIFPKSLKRFGDRRIVGINYHLLAQASRTGGGASKSNPSGRAAKPAPKTGKKVVPFAAEAPVSLPETSPAPTPEQQKETKEAARPKQPPMAPAVLRELKKAVAELRAGKTVPAYKRLDALVKTAASAE